jgi:hypothetical protein
VPDAVESHYVEPEGIPMPVGTRATFGYFPGLDSWDPQPGRARIPLLLGVGGRNGSLSALANQVINVRLADGTADAEADLGESGWIAHVPTGLFVEAAVVPQGDGTTDVEVTVNSDASSGLKADVSAMVGGMSRNLGSLQPDMAQSFAWSFQDVTAPKLTVTFTNTSGDWIRGSNIGFGGLQQVSGAFFYELAARTFVLDAGSANEGVSSWDRGMYADSHPGAGLGQDEFAFLLGGRDSWSSVRGAPSGLTGIESRTRLGQTFEAQYTGYVPGSNYATAPSLQQAQVLQAIVVGGDWGLSIANYDNAQQVFGPDVVVETDNITDITQKAGDPATGVLVYVDETADAIKFVERNAQNEYALAPAKTITGAAWAGASGKVVSAVQKADGSILFVTDGAPGELWFLPSGATVATKIADVGDAPRRVRCAGNIAAVSAYGGFGGLAFFVRNGATWTNAPFSLAAQRCIGIDAKMLPSGNVAIASADFFGQELRITTLDNTDGSILADRMYALPAVCTNPGHAAWVRDDIVDHHVLVSCNGSDNVAVVPTAPE